MVLVVVEQSDDESINTSKPPVECIVSVLLAVLHLFPVTVGVVVLVVRIVGDNNDKDCCFECGEDGRRMYRCELSDMEQDSFDLRIASRCKCSVPFERN